jgi:hypothetical protein
MKPNSFLHGNPRQRLQDGLFDDSEYSYEIVDSLPISENTKVSIFNLIDPQSTTDVPHGEYVNALCKVFGDLVCVNTSTEYILEIFDDLITNDIYWEDLANRKSLLTALIEKSRVIGKSTSVSGLQREDEND